jgi:hypothetical protein
MSEARGHGVDEYVSDCNRLPFAEPPDGRLVAGCALRVFTLGLIACGLVYGLCRLILSSLAKAGQGWQDRGGTL